MVQGRWRFAGVLRAVDGPVLHWALRACAPRADPGLKMVFLPRAGAISSKRSLHKQPGTHSQRVENDASALTGPMIFYRAVQNQISLGI